MRSPAEQGAITPPGERAVGRISHRLFCWCLQYAAIIAGCFAAICAEPRLLPNTDDVSDAYRQALIAGLKLVRVAGVVLIIVGGIAAWRNHRRDCLSTMPAPSLKVSVGLSCALLLGLALAAPRLGQSFWWDELITLVRVVDRGPAVIMAFSCDGNNHPLNSWLCWIARRIPGPLEVCLRLSPLAFFLGTIVVVYRQVTRQVSRRAGVMAAGMVASHPWIVTHAVEARGYMGAIFFSTVAYGCLTRTVPGSLHGYIFASVLACGFISTSILVPFAVGVWSLARLLLNAWRRCPLTEAKNTALDRTIASLLVGAWFFVLFGLPIPQTLAYARLAAKDHLPFSILLGEQSLHYFAGLETLWSAAFIAAISACGWLINFRRAQMTDNHWALPYLLAYLAAVAYICVPNAFASPRFFCFLLVPTCIGVAIGADAFLNTNRVGAIVVGVIVMTWIGGATAAHLRMINPGRPDLRTLAKRLESSHLALIGSQADVNQYYFPQAVRILNPHDPGELATKLTSRDYILEGRARQNNHLNEPHIALVKLGFVTDEVFPAAVPGEPEFILYRRASQQ